VADRRAEPRGRPPLRKPAVAPPAPADPGDGRIVRFRAQDDLGLAARIFDAPRSGRLPLLCLPGLSRNSRDFLALGRFFATHAEAPRTVIALDYRGRGLSDADPDWENYKPVTEAQDVLTAATVLGLEKAIVIGTSRGGIIAMLLGAMRPALLAGVVLNDIGPVMEGTGLARIKQYLSATRRLADWGEARAAVEDIAGGHFPALREEDWRALAEAIFVETPQGIVAHIDPKLTRIVERLDFSEKIPVLWPQFMSLSHVPVFAIRGELSDLLSPKTLAAMAERHPNFEQLTVPGQGHPPLLRDATSLERIAAFASRCDVL
jgi:pimeloyl-ACP methyl ester carboxylesterase